MLSLNTKKYPPFFTFLCFLLYATLGYSSDSKDVFGIHVGTFELEYPTKQTITLSSANNNDERDELKLYVPYKGIRICRFNITEQKYERIDYYAPKQMQVIDNKKKKDSEPFLVTELRFKKDSEKEKGKEEEEQKKWYSLPVTLTQFSGKIFVTDRTISNYQDYTGEKEKSNNTQQKNNNTQSKYRHINCTTTGKKTQFCNGLITKDTRTYEQWSEEFKKEWSEDKNNSNKREDQSAGKIVNFRIIKSEPKSMTLKELFKPHTNNDKKEKEILGEIASFLTFMSHEKLHWIPSRLLPRNQGVRLYFLY